MNQAFATVLMVVSPFICGGVILLSIKLHEIYTHWSYGRAVQKRNARLVRHSIAPYRGTKEWMR
jgi:hypothetical protein